MSELEAALAAERLRTDTAVNHAAELTEEIDAMQLRREDELRSITVVEQLEAELEGAVAAHGAAVDRVRSIDQERSLLEARMRELSEAHAELIGKVEVLERDFDTTMRERDSLLEEVNELRTGRAGDLAAARESSKSEVRELEHLLTVAEVERDSLVQEASDLRQELAKLTKAANAASESDGHHLEALEELENRLGDAIAVRDTYAKQVRDHEVSLAESSERREDALRRASELERALSEEQGRVRQAEEELRRLRTAASVDAPAATGRAEPAAPAADRARAGARARARAGAGDTSARFGGPARARGSEFGVRRAPLDRGDRRRGLPAPALTPAVHQVRTIASGSNALQVESAGNAASGSAISATVGPTRARDGIEPVEVEAVDLGRVRRAHRADLGFGRVRERRAQCLAAVGIRAFGVRVVAAPHDAVDADVVTQRGLDGTDEARADPAVPPEVLGRRERQLLDRRAAEVVLRRRRYAHALGEPVEVGQRAGNPTRPLLGQHELESRMALEHAREDQVPERAVRVDRDLDEHHRARPRSATSKVGRPPPL